MAQCFKADRVTTNSTCSFATWQVWSKPLPGGAAAVLLVNNGRETADVTVELAMLGVACAAGGTCRARDLWGHEDLGAVAGGSFTAKGLTPHDSMFVVVNGSSSERVRWHGS